MVGSILGGLRSGGAGGGLCRCFWSARNFGLFRGGVLHISLFYIQSLVGDHFRQFFGVLLLRTGAPRGFREGLRILRLGKGRGGKQRCPQDRYAKPQLNVPQPSLTLPTTP